MESPLELAPYWCCPKYVAAVKLQETTAKDWYFHDLDQQLSHKLDLAEIISVDIVANAS